jgi:hypothetical protein
MKKAWVFCILFIFILNLSFSQEMDKEKITLVYINQPMRL